MINHSASDTLFWIQFLHDSNLSIDNNTLLQYAKTLSDRFSSVEELLASNENELINLGITNQLDRTCLIKQASLFDEKKNFVLTQQLDVSNHILDNCYGNNPCTLLNRKSKCNLSSTLLSRISFHNHFSYNELTNDDETCHFEHTLEKSERTMINDDNEKIQELIESYQKKTQSISSHGMRPIKKRTTGTDHLKRLNLSRSLFTRQTRSDQILKQIHEIDELELNEHQQTQVFSFHNESQQSMDLNSYQDTDESKRNIQLVQTLINKRFKLGATTTFLTRSLANYDYMK
ncbi:unnamed protein product [Rotaria sp. Silwood1]|nr:unnamed protein product [Rotaria sp. Silwood1]